MVCAAAFFCATAYYLPLIYLPLFADTLPGFNDPDLAFYLISIVNGVSTVGRLITGGIAQKTGPTETFLAAVAFCTIILFSWMAVSDKAGIIVWSIFWGLASSVIVSLPGAIVPLFTPSINIIGTRSGMVWASVALGILIGGPIGGAIVDQDAMVIDWNNLQIFAGIFMLAGTISTIYPVWCIRKRRLLQD
jgi:predicted MFS family arabinose efflux permease